jgi:hypothetical protein
MATVKTPQIARTGQAIRQFYRVVNERIRLA